MIYKGTLPDSPARRFVNDLWSTAAIKSLFRDFGHLHPDFAEDIVDVLVKSQLSGSWITGNVAENNGIAAYLETPKEN
jgi:hypothetical protein